MFKGRGLAVIDRWSAFICSTAMKASSVWKSWNVREQINDVVLKTISLPTPLIATIEWSTNTFHYPLSTLSWLREQSRDLTSVSLAFKSSGFHLPVSGIALTLCYIVSRCTSGVRYSQEGSQSYYEKLK